MSSLFVLRVAIILREEFPSLCKSSLPIGQQLRYGVEQWMFCLPVDSNMRYDDRPLVVIYNRSFRDIE